MESQRNVFIARNGKTGFHSVFHIVSSDYSQERHGALDAGTLNELIRWNTLEELVAVLSKTGPLIASDVYKEASRIITIEDALSIANAQGKGKESEGYGRNDESFLYMQLYLDGGQGAYPSHASIARGIKNHGLIESDAAASLAQWAKADPKCRVVIEPLCDIILMRNLSSITLRLIANYQNANIEDVLEASGFVKIGKEKRWWISRKLEESYYVIPFFHNPADDKTINFSTKWFHNVFAYMLIEPLLETIREQATKNDRYCFGSTTAMLLTAPTIMGKGRPFFNSKMNYDEEDTRYYLALPCGASQRETVKEFVMSLASMFSGLRGKSGDDLGWDFTIYPPLSGNDGPKPLFHTLASAMVGGLIYRNNVLLTTCKNCGNGILLQPKRKPKEFCSNSCRTIYSKNADSAMTGELDKEA